MKTTGWICLIIGVLSFMGAALKGNSVFGPIFWISLGAFLLYLAANKEQVNEKKPSVPETIREEDIQMSDSTETPVDENDVDAQQPPAQQPESLEDITSQLTLQQREAAMCLISFFGGYNDNLMDDATIVLFKQAALFFGLSDSPTAMSRIMSKYTDADMLVDIVLTIKPVKAKEFLLLTCYDLIKTSKKSEAHDLLYNIASDMGYDKPKLDHLIGLYQ